MSESNEWVEGLEADGHSGPTALGKMSDLNWNSPIAQLKNYLDSNNFIIDTNRLNRLASFAYRDLRKSSFSNGTNGLVNNLDKHAHSMGQNFVLLNGDGYYFAQIDSLGKYTGIDLGFEHWKIDTTSKENVEQLGEIWKEKYHPMPLYYTIKADNLYVIYTRSVQYAHHVRSCLTVLEQSF